MAPAAPPAAHLVAAADLDGPRACTAPAPRGIVAAAPRRTSSDALFLPPPPPQPPRRPRSIAVYRTDGAAGRVRHVATIGYPGVDVYYGAVAADPAAPDVVTVVGMVTGTEQFKSASALFTCGAGRGDGGGRWEGGVAGARAPPPAPPPRPPHPPPHPPSSVDLAANAVTRALFVDGGGNNQYQVNGPPGSLDEVRSGDYSDVTAAPGVGGVLLASSQGQSVDVGTNDDGDPINWGTIVWKLQL